MKYVILGIVSGLLGAYFLVLRHANAKWMLLGFRNPSPQIEKLALWVATAVGIIPIAAGLGLVVAGLFGNR